MRTKTVLALVLFCLTLGAYFPLCARLFSSSPDSLAATGDAQFDRGRELFVELGCNTCHAREGTGSDKGPNLDLIASAEHRERIFHAIMEPPAEPSPQYEGLIMPRGQVDHLSDEDVDALLYYLTHATPSVE